MKTVSFHNLGCKVNSYEMEVMQQNFIKCGYIIVPFDKRADICVINTCTVTNIADRKSRQMLHRVKKLNPDAVIVAVGCYVQAVARQRGTENSGVFMLRDEGIDLCIGNNSKNKIVEVVEAYLADERKNENTPDIYNEAVTDISAVCEYEDMHLEHTMEHERAYIKIQDGCDQFCTYCAIPYVRGRVRSRHEDSIIKEITTLAEEGYKEYVLTGIHLSSYGLNHAAGDEPYNVGARETDYTNKALLDLIEHVSMVPGVERIRLGSLEPGVITEGFLDRLSTCEKICPHFHLSLQSGCDRTLKRMNRRYTTEEYLKKVELLRKYYDMPAITTDIITGFPGEDDEEFSETVAFVEKVRFYETHIFKYSKRAGTVAASLPGQNTEAVKADRSNILAEINERNGLAFRQAHIGCYGRILIEEEKDIDDRKVMIGYTDDYVQAAVEADVFPGDIIYGKAVGMLNDEVVLYGVQALNNGKI